MQKYICTLIFIFLFSEHLQADLAPALERFHVCTVASYEHKNLHKLMHSCKNHQIDLKVLGLGLPYEGNGTKLILFGEYLNTLEDDEIVMLIDAFDIILVADKEVILNKFLNMNTPFVMSAEKICFPFPDLAPQYPLTASPFKYINAGAYMGYVKDLKAWYNDLPAVNPKISDQGQITTHYLNGNNFFMLDNYCEIFLSLFAVEDHELDIDVEHGIVRCLTTNSEPCVIHANGSSFRLWDIIYEKLIIQPQELMR